MPGWNVPTREDDEIFKVRLRADDDKIEIIAPQNAGEEKVAKVAR